MPSFTYTSAIPAGSDIPSQSQSQLQTNCTSVNGLVNVDLYGFNNSNGGYHQKSTYVDQGSDPGSLSGQVVEYSKLVGSSSELFIQRDAVSTAIQMTAGTVAATSSGHSFLPGGIIIQWGNIGINNGNSNSGSQSFPIAFPNNLFSFSAIGNTSATANAYGLSFIYSLSNYTIYRSSTGGTVTYYWIAIGN